MKYAEDVVALAGIALITWGAWQLDILPGTAIVGGATITLAVTIKALTR